MTQGDLAQYWIETAEHDFISMQHNFASGDYVWALFIGHLVIEKLLKACCVGARGMDIPRSHNLVYLAEIAKIETDERQKKCLASLTRFNVLTRYPDWQGRFYQAASREYTQEHVEIVKELRAWLLHQLKQSSRS